MSFEEKYAGKLKEIEQMGALELESFKMYVASTLLDNPTKHYFYDAIEKREDKLRTQNRQSAMAECAAVELD